MIFEYLRNAYNNMFRFPNRFWTIIVTVSLATFCLLGLTAMIQSSKNVNQHKLESMSAQNINYQQFIVQTASLKEKISPKQVPDIIDTLGADSGYYFEDLSAYMWDYDYLIPWIDFNGQLILETTPMLVGLENDVEPSALKEKIKYGDYFTGDANEIIISDMLLNQFIETAEVFDGELIIIDDGKRRALKNGEGEKVTPETILGKSIEFIYNIGFKVDKESGKYYIKSKTSIPLKVVGIFDSKIGYQTPGNVWLPLNLKNELAGLNMTSVERSKRI